ncbi:uncharacterized protein LOC121371968 isoform X2 [Gigantopelta aegis]|uniref:uncharacterized protein LOC121371968 isoform X2 n=1 Tax=Gigantopelta aegis TaxID=1735272 RepID=UPI001B889439|nr:uncharacterized protein LOC121371968 isoform X2 [Gigantopelta aegis]
MSPWHCVRHQYVYVTSTTHGKVPSRLTERMRVYVWMPVDNLVGHSSLRLSDGTYISWWPDADKEKQLPLVTLKARSSPSLAKDIRSEGRRPTHIFNIRNRFQEEQIKQWWETYKHEGSYILGSTNCCWIVYRALTEGGAPWQYNVTPWRPNDVKCYCESLNEYYQATVKKSPSEEKREKETSFLDPF